MKTETVQSEYIDCNCHSIDHTINITYFKYDGVYPENVIISTQLTMDKNVFKRIWLVIKYIFGKPLTYGHWAETLIAPDDYSKIIDIFKQAQADHNKHLSKLKKLERKQKGK